jgi:hypothetical protein
MMGRVNYGKHVIVSTETHAALKKDCQEAGVLMTEVCDSIMRVFAGELKKRSQEERKTILQGISAGHALGEAFAPFAELIRLAVEGGTVVDATGGGKDVTPEKPEGPGKDPPK